MASKLMESGGKSKRKSLSSLLERVSEFSDQSDQSDPSEILLNLLFPYCLGRYNKVVSWLPYCAS